MVVKPAHLTEGRSSPASSPWSRVPADHLRPLLQRLPGGIRSRQHGLGIEEVTAFIGHQPLWKVHQAVFALLALELAPVYPRLQ